MNMPRTKQRFSKLVSGQKIPEVIFEGIRAICSFFPEKTQKIVNFDQREYLCQSEAYMIFET